MNSPAQTIAPDYIEVSSPRRTLRVSIDQIIRFEADDKYIMAYTQHEAMLLINTSLKQLERLYADQVMLVRRGHLVFRRHIAHIAPDRGHFGTVVLTEGTEIPLARSTIRRTRQGARGRPHLEKSAQPVKAPRPQRCHKCLRSGPCSCRGRATAQPKRTSND